MNKQFTLLFGGQPYKVEIDSGKIIVNDKTFQVTRQGISVQVNGRPYTVEMDGDQATVDGITYPITISGAGGAAAASKPAARKRAAETSAADDPGHVTAIMPGKILRLLVAEGDQIQEGDVLIILEAMKMENELHAKKSGTIKQLNISPGDDVEMGELLAVIE